MGPGITGRQIDSDKVLKREVAENKSKANRDRNNITWMNS